MGIEETGDKGTVDVRAPERGRDTACKQLVESHSSAYPITVHPRSLPASTMRKLHYSEKGRGCSVAQEWPHQENCKTFSVGQETFLLDIVIYFLLYTSVVWVDIAATFL